MPKIISFDHKHKFAKENVFKSLWEQFQELDRFLKIMFVSYIFIAISTPFIVFNYQIFNSAAQIDMPEATTQESSIQDNVNNPCNEFLPVEGEISCQEALVTAFSVTSGTIKKISKDSRRVFVPPLPKPGQGRFVNLWLIDIQPSNSYFDGEFNHEVKVLRIGIPLNGEKFTYKELVE